MLVQRTASRLVWVFGVPQALEQLPQRAVHSALAIRQMVVEASAPDLPPCPTVRLAVHLGAVRVDRQAADPTAQVLAVGETLALPVRLLGQAEPGADRRVARGGALGGRLGGPGRAAVAVARRGLRARGGVCRRGGEPRARGVGWTSAPHRGAPWWAGSGN